MSREKQVLLAESAKISIFDKDFQIHSILRYVSLSLPNMLNMQKNREKPFCTSFSCFFIIVNIIMIYSCMKSRITD